MKPFIHTVYLFLVTQLNFVTEDCQLFPRYSPDKIVGVKHKDNALK